MFRTDAYHPSIEDLPLFGPGAYTAGPSGEKDKRALLAYGLAAHLANERPREFLALLEAFARDFVDHGESDPAYMAPPWKTR